jgi:hypothetical protein
MAVERDLLALEIDRGVDIRVVARRQHCGAHDERGRREGLGEGLLATVQRALAQARAGAHERGGIDLAVVDDAGDLEPRAGERVGDGAAHAAQGDDLAGPSGRGSRRGRPRRGRRGRGRGALHVLAQDPPVRAAAGDVLERDAELARQAAGGRGGERQARALGGGRAVPGSCVAGSCVSGSFRPVDLEDRQHSPHVDRLALFSAQPHDDAGGWTRDDRDGLVGLDLDEVLVLAHMVALGDVPGEDLRCGDALAHIGQPELHHASSAARTAARTRSTDGRYSSSTVPGG